MCKEYISRNYEFLMGELSSEDNPAQDKTFPELKEINIGLREIFQHCIPLRSSILTQRADFFHEDCHISLGGERDRERGGKGGLLCLGSIIITGIEENISRVEDILGMKFSGITGSSD